MDLQMAIIGVWLREVLAARIYAEAEAPVPSFDLDNVELSRWPDLCPCSCGTPLRLGPIGCAVRHRSVALRLRLVEWVQRPHSEATDIGCIARDENEIVDLRCRGKQGINDGDGS